MVFLHSSDELYGADRLLLEMIDAVPDARAVEVWLPTDLPHPAAPLCVELERRGVRVRHEPLPIMRRAYRTPSALWMLVRRTAGLARQLRRDRPAVVYCTTSAAYLGAAAARAARVRWVVGHVQEFWSGTDRIALTPLALLFHRLIAISDAVATALPATVSRRATVVLNASGDPGPVEQIGDEPGPLSYLVASRWNGWKGHRTLLAAWDRAGCPGRLVVLGGPPSSGEAVDVRALVAGLRRPESVQIVGEVTDISPYLVASDVVVMPSDDPEPFGLVAIEAFARSRPVIASAAGGLVEIVEDQVNGWLFAPRDVPALADVLIHLDRAQVRGAGHRARDTYEQRFTIERYAAEWRAAVLGD